MTANEAKKAVAALLDREGIGYTKLTARKVSFQDLARAEVYAVKPHGMELPEPRLQNVRAALRGVSGVILDV